MGANGEVEGSQGPASSFPTTAWSLVVNLTSDDERRIEAVGRLFRMYHAPILAHLRRTWRKLPFEEIEDRASAFYAHLLEKDALQGFDTAKSRFRTFLKMVLDRFARDKHDGDTALRRGGKVRHVSFTGNRERLDQVLADHEAATPGEILDLVVQQEFLAAAKERLRAWAESTGRAKQFEALRLYLESDPELTYRQVAERLGVKESDVRNHIHGMRKRLEREIQELVKPTVANPDEDLKAEIQDLYGRRAEARRSP